MPKKDCPNLEYRTKAQSNPGAAPRGPLVQPYCNLLDETCNKNLPTCRGYLELIPLLVKPFAPENQQLAQAFLESAEQIVEQLALNPEALPPKNRDNIARLFLRLQADLLKHYHPDSQVPAYLGRFTQTTLLPWQENNTYQNLSYVTDSNYSEPKTNPPPDLDTGEENKSGFLQSNNTFESLWIQTTDQAWE